MSTPQLRKVYFKQTYRWVDVDDVAYLLFEDGSEILFDSGDYILMEDSAVGI